MSTAEKIDPSNVDRSKVGWVTRSKRQLIEPPNLRKPTNLRGAVGAWNRKSGDHIKGCDGARIHAADFLTGADS